MSTPHVHTHSSPSSHRCSIEATPVCQCSRVTSQTWLDFCLSRNSSSLTLMTAHPSTPWKGPILLLLPALPPSPSLTSSTTSRLEGVSPCSFTKAEYVGITVLHHLRSPLTCVPSGDRILGGQDIPLTGPLLESTWPFTLRTHSAHTHTHKHTHTLHSQNWLVSSHWRM